MREDVRLDKILSNSGIGSRKSVRGLLAAGRICVNGIVVKAPDLHVHPKNDTIQVDGEPLHFAEHAYVMMNKKAGWLCSTKSSSGYATVYDFLPPEVVHTYAGGTLQCVGRLDVDTEGLLLFTTDGTLHHYLTTPKWQVPKTYEVFLHNAVQAEVRNAYTARLKEGLFIPAEGKEKAVLCKSAHLVWKDEGAYTLPWNSSERAPAVCEITVYEGKFHEIKRLFAALGNEVSYLKRLSINNLVLDKDLALGECRALTQDEVALVSNGMSA